MGEYTFILLIVAGVVIWWLSARGRKSMLSEAKRAYRDALDRLKQTPTDPDRREQALELGREYAKLTRNLKGVATFDEMALKNDIDAACAGAVEFAAVQAGKPASPAAEIRKLTGLLDEGILTPEEWQSAKAQLVGLKQNQVDEAVKLLRALHELEKAGGLSEAEYNMKKWDILSQKLISPGRPPIVPPRTTEKT
jgi:hypothetical protein